MFSTDLKGILLGVGKELHTCRLLFFVFLYLTAILPSSINSRILGPLFRLDAFVEILEPQNCLPYIGLLTPKEYLLAVISCMIRSEGRTHHIGIRRRFFKMGGCCSTYGREAPLESRYLILQAERT